MPDVSECWLAVGGWVRHHVLGAYSSQLCDSFLGEDEGASGGRGRRPSLPPDLLATGRFTDRIKDIITQDHGR